MATITSLTVAEISRKGKTGDLSAQEVVEAHIRRIEEANPLLNAVAIPRFEQAREEAEAADAARRRGDPLGPLHGVPITIKGQCRFARGRAGCRATLARGHCIGSDACP